ncbi:MAG: hypothetical protein ACYSSP_13050 [Planctomycetota bacterium]|jgi:hypothetical protein
MEKEERKQVKSGKKSTYQILEELEQLMREFRKRFLKVSLLKAKGYLPNRLLNDDNVEYGGSEGDLTIINHGDSCGIKFNIFPEELYWKEDYLFEDLIFQIWSYSTGKSLSTNISNVYFELDDPGDLAFIEDAAAEAEKINFQLTLIQRYKKLAGDIYQIIRPLPKWKPCKKSLTFIREIDYVLKKIEYAKKRELAVTEKENQLEVKQRTETLNKNKGKKRGRRLKYTDEHNDFLQKVAMDVFGLVLEPDKRAYFRKQVEAFSQKVKEHQNELDKIKKDYEANSKLKKEARKLADQVFAEGSEVNQEVFYACEGKGFLEDFKDYIYYDNGNYWGPIAQTPDLVHYMTDFLDSPIPNDHKKPPSGGEKILCYYTLLSAIHDKHVKEKPIFFDKPEELYYNTIQQHWVVKIIERCRCSDAIYRGWFDRVKDTQAWILRALAYVKSDLEKIQQERIKKVAELDKIDQKIIDIYQEAEKQAVNNPKGKIKLPGTRKIANALHKSGITNKEYTHTAIGKRIKKLRDAGLIGHPDDRKDRAKRCAPEHLSDMNDGIKEKF